MANNRAFYLKAPLKDLKDIVHVSNTSIRKKKKKRNCKSQLLLEPPSHHCGGVETPQ